MRYRTTRAAIIVLVLLVAMAPGALAWGMREERIHDVAPDASREPLAIVPKRSVGPITFGMTKDELVRVLGKPNAIFYGDAHFSLRDAPTIAYYVFSRSGLSVLMQWGRIRSVSVLSEQYSLPNGLRVGMTMADVRKVFSWIPDEWSEPRWDGTTITRRRTVFSGGEEYRILDYGEGVALKVSLGADTIKEIRLAATGIASESNLAFPNQEEPIMDQDAQAQRAVHKRWLPETSLPFDRYALVRVRWALRESPVYDVTRDFRYASCSYVLKYSDEKQEHGKAAAFVSSMDDLGPVGPAIKDIVARYGLPTVVEVQSVAGNGDAIFRLFYGDFPLMFDANRGTLSSATISRLWDPVYRFKGIIGLGSAQAAVFATLGANLRTAPEGLAGIANDRTLFTPTFAGEDFATISYADIGLSFEFHDGSVIAITRQWR